MPVSCVVSLTLGLLIGARWALIRLVASYCRADGGAPSVREQRCVQASRCLTIVGTTGPARPQHRCVCERRRKKQRRSADRYCCYCCWCCSVLVVDCSRYTRACSASSFTARAAQRLLSAPFSAGVDRLSTFLEQSSVKSSRRQ